MRTPLLDAAALTLRLVLILSLSGIPALAQPQSEPSQPSPSVKPKLVLAKEGCAVQCNASPSCKAPQMKPEVCDYADTQGSFTKFDTLDYKEQVKLIQTESQKAAAAFSKFESAKTALLAATNPEQVAHDKVEAKKKKLDAMYGKLESERKQIASDFLSGALKHDRTQVYTKECDAQLAQIKQKNGEAKAEFRKKIEDSSAKMAAKTGDQNGKIGQARTAAAKLDTGSDTQRSAASAAMFDGNSRHGKAGPPAPSARSSPQLGDSHSLAAGSMRGSYSSQYGSGHVQDMAVGEGHGEPSAAPAPTTIVERRKLTGNENSYVKFVKGVQGDITTHGAQMQAGADQQSRLADQSKAAHDKAASSEWEKGNYFSAAWEKTKGVGGYVAHTGAEAAYKVEQGRAAVQNYALDVARGDPKAVKVVAVTGAVVATVVTAGAAAPAIAAAAATAGVVSTTTAAAAGTVLLTSAGAGITTYGITQGTGKMARAESKTEFAVGGAEVAVNALAGPIVKGGGKLLGYGAEAVGMGKQATAVAEFFGHGTAHAAEATAGKAAVEIAATQAEKTVSRIAFGQAEQHLVTHGITHAAEHAVTSTVEDVGEMVEEHAHHTAAAGVTAPRGHH